MIENQGIEAENVLWEQMSHGGKYLTVENVLWFKNLLPKAGKCLGCKLLVAKNVVSRFQLMHGAQCNILVRGGGGGK